MIEPDRDCSKTAALSSFLDWVYTVGATIIGNLVVPPADFAASVQRMLRSSCFGTGPTSVALLRAGGDAPESWLVKQLLGM